MTITDIKPNQILQKGDKIIHKTTLEVGEVMEEGLSRGICRVIYPASEMWYPQPKENIMLIKNKDF